MTAIPTLRRIGLTGGIGSGKSTVARIWRGGCIIRAQFLNRIAEAYDAAAAGFAEAQLPSPRIAASSS